MPEFLPRAEDASYTRRRPNSYSDFNRATKSLRQPGSAMKPFVYLAAFRQGIFNLESMVPDAPSACPTEASRLRNGFQITTANLKA